jgi:hypothetical protein
MEEDAEFQDGYADDLRRGRIVHMQELLCALLLRVLCMFGWHPRTLRTVRCVGANVMAMGVWNCGLNMSNITEHQQTHHDQH